MGEFFLNNASAQLAEIDASGKAFWPSVLLFIYILLPDILAAGIETFFFLCLLLFAGIWWIASREKLPSEISRFAGPLLIVVLIGLLGSEGHRGYDVAKDVWYVTNAALAIIVGYVLMKNMQDMGRFFRVFVIAGTIIAIFYLRPFVLYPVLFKLDIDELRRLSGGGPMTPCISLGVLLVSSMSGIRLFKGNPWLFSICATFCSLAVLLSFSRTMLAALLLIALAVFGWIQFTKFSRLAFIVVMAVSILAVGLMMPVSDIGMHSSLFDKILFSLQEIRVTNYYSMASINEHWRGYEMLRALYTYLLGTPWQYLVGGGFGTNVDLGLFMDLGGERIRFVPILHNGYMYLLVKTGLVGFFLYLLLLYRVTRRGTLMSLSKQRETLYVGRFLVGLGLVFAATTFVIGGMFNKAGMLSTLMLLGALLAYGSRPVSSGEAR